MSSAPDFPELFPVYREVRREKAVDFPELFPVYREVHREKAAALSTCMSEIHINQGFAPQNQSI